MPKRKLNIKTLVAEAAKFAEVESTYDEPSLYGVTDGKAVGTYLEHKFTQFLANKYAYEKGNSASGIDFPGLGVDMKVTSMRQPQSSCPYKSARQKVFGLGYSLLEEILNTAPEQGYLTMSNALQWRLQYGRVIQEAGKVKGIYRIR